MDIKSFFNKIWTNIFLKNAIIAFAAVLIVFLLAKFSLSIYTKHGQTILVPDFSNMTIEDAEKTAYEKSLVIEKSGEAYSLTKKPGTILNQTPPPDFKVKSGRKIFVTIIAEKYVNVPDLRGQLRAAASVAQSYGLRIKIETKPGETDWVYEQKYKGKPIAVGTKVPYGSEIVLIVGKSKGDKTDVPSLTGLNYREAEALLAEHNLNLGTIMTDKAIYTLEDSLNAKVYKQYPSAKRTLQPGTEVDIWISLSTKSEDDDELK